MEQTEKPAVAASFSIRTSVDDLQMLNDNQCEAFLLGVSAVIAAYNGSPLVGPPPPTRRLLMLPEPA